MREQDLIRAVWTGQSFVPDGNYALAQTRDRLGDGQVVNLDLDPERSAKSHRHAFAFVRTAWMNLPEHNLGTPYAVSTEALRKYALIQTGYCNTEMMAMGTTERANRAAALLSRVSTNMHGFAITNVIGTVVYCHTPHSQSMKSMGGAKFAESKTAILEFLADMIGANPDDLYKMHKKEA
tara:strand:- start:653 stop:1192 length:540 start_codon:yes stop_codon:yes gene_type:complete